MSRIVTIRVGYFVADIKECVNDVQYVLEILVLKEKTATKQNTE